MPFAVIKRLSIPCLAIGLSACASHPGVIAASEPSFVDKVDVGLNQGLASPRFADLARAKTRREATRYGRGGAAKHLRISVTEFHYKDAAKSLLIGDANLVRARVAVSDAATGRPHGEFDAMAIDNVAINGVLGAVMAATQNKEQADERLAEGLASNVMEQVYGSAVAAQARKRPAVEIVDAPEPAAPAVKPAAPAKTPNKTPVPTASATPKTAIADTTAAPTIR